MVLTLRKMEGLSLSHALSVGRVHGRRPRVQRRFPTVPMPQSLRTGPRVCGNSRPLSAGYRRQSLPRHPPANSLLWRNAREASGAHWRQRDGTGEGIGDWGKETQAGCRDTAPGSWARVPASEPPPATAAPGGDHSASTHSALFWAPEPIFLWGGLPPPQGHL